MINDSFVEELVQWVESRWIFGLGTAQCAWIQPPRRM